MPKSHTKITNKQGTLKGAIEDLYPGGNQEPFFLIELCSIGRNSCLSL